MIGRCRFPANFVVSPLSPHKLLECSKPPQTGWLPSTTPRNRWFAYNRGRRNSFSAYSGKSAFLLLLLLPEPITLVVVAVVGGGKIENIIQICKSHKCSSEMECDVTPDPFVATPRGSALCTVFFGSFVFWWWCCCCNCYMYTALHCKEAESSGEKLIFGNVLLPKPGTNERTNTRIGFCALVGNRWDIFFLLLPDQSIIETWKEMYQFFMRMNDVQRFRRILLFSF